MAKEPIPTSKDMDSPTQEPWTPERVQELIDKKIEEGAQLDYKAAAALNRSDSKKTDQITKDVSAFANSAGGTIIYGLKEFDDDARKHLPEKIDPIDGRDYSREWLDQIIGQISPRIEGVKITPIRVGPETWHTCYVVEIPQGHTAHQARDLRYYRRYNFESVPMSDYEIRDVMNRRERLNLIFQVRIGNTGHMTFKVMARIWNKGPVLARHYKVRVLVPTIIEASRLAKDDLMLQEESGFKFWRVSLGSALSKPLFPNDDVIHDIEIPYLPPYVPHPSLEPATDYLLCSLYADEMPPLRRKISVESAMKGWV